MSTEPGWAALGRRPLYKGAGFHPAPQPALGTRTSSPLTASSSLMANSPVTARLPLAASLPRKASLPLILGVLLAATGLVAGTLASKSSVGTAHRALSPARRGQVRRGMAALPVAARGPISAALGRSDRGYWIQGLRAANPAQKFAVRFTGGGVAISSGTGRLSLRMAEFGRENALRAIPSASALTSANRVTYVSPTVRQWYVNGPFGLEQGFDVNRAPAGQGALALVMALSPGVRAHRTPTGVLLTGGGASLRYSGLSATDARGRALPASLLVRAGRVELRVDDRGATYPVRVDPFVQQGSKLVGDDATGDAAQGISVALSANGNTALVGGPRDDNGIGAAWVFTRSNSTWTQQGPKLVASDATAGANLGFGVALSANGNTALIGGYGDDHDTGAAWVFTRAGSTWTQQGSKLVGNDATGTAYQGYSVGLSADGKTAVVGGPGDAGETGAMWVYTRSGSAWTQDGAKLVGSGSSANAAQGFAVAVSGDGAVAMSGGPDDDNNLGGAWVFTRAGSDWTQAGSELLASDATGAAAQGFSVALSSDGSTALVGGPGDNNDVGAAWAYTRSGSTWTQQGTKLVGSDASGTAGQGFAVGVSADGNSALVGGGHDDGDMGAAWLYSRVGSVWSQQGAKLVGSDATAGAEQGFSVALSSDAGTVLFGGPTDDGQGAVWAFSFTAAKQSIQHSLTVTVGGSGSGVVSGSGVSCPGGCTHAYAAGTTLTLTATPSAGSTFSGWSGGCSGTGACNLTMNSDQKVRAVFVAAATGATTPESSRPVLSGLTISPHRLRLTGLLSRGACIGGTRLDVSRRVCTRKARSIVSYQLNIAANVTITVARALPGRRVNGRCVRPTRVNRRRASCSRLVVLRGVVKRTGARGNNTFVFNDRIGGRALTPGRYRLIATPNAHGLSGIPQTTMFTVAR